MKNSFHGVGEEIAPGLFIFGFNMICFGFFLFFFFLISFPLQTHVSGGGMEEEKNQGGEALAVSLHFSPP
jgi:hypothetical protein